MATIRKEIELDAPVDEVWDAVRDVGAVDERLARGFVADVKLENGARLVTFANGFVVRELIVGVDDEARRVAYAAVGGRTSHHNSSMQVLHGADGGTLLVWITDLLPDEAAAPVREMVEHGAAAIKQTLERRD